jgi:hypothetical protein
MIASLNDHSHALTRLLRSVTLTHAFRLLFLDAASLTFTHAFRLQLPHVAYSRAKRAISHYAQHVRERDCACDLVYFLIFIPIVFPS